MVADFGIALAVQTAGGQRLTQTGLSLGTPQYMSPEQAMGECTIDARSDIYALGAVTYEMLAGEPPFTGASVQAIVAKVLSERPVSLGTLRDRVSPSLNDADMGALSRAPCPVARRDWCRRDAGVQWRSLLARWASEPSAGSVQSHGATDAR